MKQIYNAKTYIEEILLGTNNNGIGFVNESAYNHFTKARAFSAQSGNGNDYNFAKNVISVGLLHNDVLEIGIDARAGGANAYCGCLKNDVCRKLMLDSRYVEVVTKRRYNAQLQLTPGKKVGDGNLAYQSSYGSLGFFLFPYSDKNNPYFITNNHVIANSNDATVGDAIYSLDGSPIKIGFLKNYLPINPFGANHLDLAVGELQGFGAPTPTASPGYRLPVLGEKVYKNGATTGNTQGIVRSLNYSTKINYGKFEALFVDQIQISTGITNYPFSLGGDSGSLIRSSGDNSFVGLLFAGNGTWTLANRQPLVIQQLKQWGFNIK